MKKDPRVLFSAFSLIAGLFIFHTSILFYTSWIAARIEKDLILAVGAHFTGIAIVLGAFVALFLAHLTEGATWAVYLWKRKLLPNYHDAFYFTLTSLTALGYGDILLPKGSRLLGPLMATSGLLMFGCSTAFLFLIIQRTWEALPKTIIQGVM